MSPILFRVLSRKDALDENYGRIGVNGRFIISLFAIDSLADEEPDIQALAESLDIACTRY